MALAVGDRVPAATFRTMTADGIKELSTADVFDGKKVVLFGVPGAFTPSCHKNHLPGYVRRHEEIKSTGVDTIACVAVNDAVDLDAWAKASQADGRVLMLADGNADFVKAAGLSFDGSGLGLGPRSKRFSALVEDGVVRELNVEEKASEVTVSSADQICQL